MATYTTTPFEEAAITAHRDLINKQREKDGLPVLDDNAAYVAVLLSTAVGAYVEQRVQVVADAYRGASPDDRLKAEAALKVP